MRRLLPAVVLASFCMASVATPASHLVPDVHIYISHVTVIDVETGRENADQTVTIAGNRILSVAPSSSIRLPAHSRIVQGAGKYLIPGLWDMHVHVWDHEPVFALILANGVTGVREMAGPLSANKFRAERAMSGKIAPHFFLASPLIDGHPQIWAIHSIEVTAGDDARAVVDEQKHLGADFIKIYDRLSRDSYYAIADESTRLGISFVGHVPNAISAREASAAKQKSIEHLWGLAFACSTREEELRPKLVAARSPQDIDALTQLARDSYSEQKCTQLFADFKANSTWQVPTLSTWRAYSRVNDAQALKDPRLRYFGGALHFSLDGRVFLEHDEAKGNESATEAADSAAREFAFDERLVGPMFRAGVPLLAGTDAGALLSFPGFALHDELAVLVEAGVSPLGALQSATRNPAIFMNATSEYGSVTAGRMADLVLLDADPLQDIRNTTKISTVIFAGKVFDRAALDKILQDAIDTAAQDAISAEP